MIGVHKMSGSAHIELPENARLTFLINSMEGGGAERALANLLRHLKPHLAGVQTELVLLDDKPNVQSLPGGISVNVLDGRGSLLRSYRELSRHWKNADQRPDICISFLARSNVLNAWVAKRIGYRSVICERVHTTAHLSGVGHSMISKFMTRMCYPRADHVVAVSEGIADDLVQNFGVDRSRLTVIGNPIDAQHLNALADEAPNFEPPEDFLLGVGRLVANKNFSMVLHAISKVPDAPPLVILGQGPEEDMLRDLARNLGLENKVHFAGYVENPYPIMRRARALVSASRAEGFPNSIVEAMSLGCPVIATDCLTGPAEILMSESQTEPPWSKDSAGILVPLEDVDAMSKAISSMCDDGVRRDFSARARKRSGAYGIVEVVSEYLAVLNRQARLLTSQ